MNDNGYWLTPPNIFKILDDEFHFDCDPCPHPLLENFDGLKIEWGRCSYVNPPFHKVNGKGPTAFMRKAIEENKKGKSVVIVAPTQSYVNLMIEAGAELRSLGRVRWLHSETLKPCCDPSPITAFVLRGE
jgi:hypothetical protein